MGRNNILRKIYVEVGWEQKALKTSAVQSNVHEMSSLPIPHHAYIMIGKTWKSTNLIFLWTKEIQRNFGMYNLLAIVTCAINISLKDQLFKISCEIMCDNAMCHRTCNRMTFKARSDVGIMIFMKVLVKSTNFGKSQKRVTQIKKNTYNNNKKRQRKAVYWAKCEAERIRYNFFSLNASHVYFSTIKMSVMREAEYVHRSILSWLQS